MALETGDVLPHVIARHAAECGDEVFCREVGGGSVTHAQFHDANLRWASALAALGLGEGERMCTLMETGLEAVSAWLGASWLRAMEVPLNPDFRGRTLRHALSDSRCQVVVCSAALMPQLVAEREFLGTLTDLRHIVVPDADDPPSVEGVTVIGRSAFFAAERRDDFEGPGPRDIAAIIYTSGTTGPSKGVLVTWTQLHATALAALPADVGPTDVYYATLPLFHTSGKRAIYGMQLVGGSMVMRPRFSRTAFWSDVREYGCTTTILLGAMATFLVTADPAADDADNPLRDVLMLPVVPDHEAFTARFGVQIRTLYNMTEVSCPISTEGPIVDPASCGRPRAGYSARVVDENDEEVPAGQYGELVIRSDDPWRLMAGYWGRPEETVRAWRNLWLHTGDGFRQDADGNFYFVDRMTDSIRRRGENVSSVEVEAEVNDHPAVAESAVVAVRAEEGEDEIKAVIVLRPGEHLDAPGLWEFLMPRLPRHMVPRYVEFVDELPVTPTQKVRKNLLREQGVTAATADRERIAPTRPVGNITG